MPDGPEKDRAAALALQLYGPAPKKRSKKELDKFTPYRFRPWDYIRDFLGWEPWNGTEKYPGQMQILEACVLALRQQLEKREYELGNVDRKDLQFYDPEKKIKNWIRVESGNGTGKTKIISGTVNWFFDCFSSITYTFSTSATQDEVTSWKEIRKDRRGKGLPGRILNTKLYLPDSDDRFAMSRSPSKSGGTGEEKTKGQHNEYLLFVIDEADGAEDFIFDAIDTMVSGGIYLVLMLANPRSRDSRFHQLRKYSHVRTLRISSLSHPNVVSGKEIIPGAVKRDFVEKEIEKSCEVLHIHDDSCTLEEHNKFHDEEKFTFELPYAVMVKEQRMPPGTIFRPSPEFMTRVLGIAPPNALDRTLIPVGVYEAACQRKPRYDGDPTRARVGLDAARFGDDLGTMYIRWQDAIWKALEISKGDTYLYMGAIKPLLLDLREKGVTSLHVRVDAGYGSGLIDALRKNDELKKAFDDYKVMEVSFNGSAYSKDYYNIITELYAEAAESLKTLCVLNPAERLETDLCEREYEWRNLSGRDVKILEPKEKFKKRHKHSPDDGDGFVLAAGPDFCFKATITAAPVTIGKVSTWTV